MASSATLWQLFEPAIPGALPQTPGSLSSASGSRSRPGMRNLLLSAFGSLVLASAEASLGDRGEDEGSESGVESSWKCEIAGFAFDLPRGFVSPARGKTPRQVLRTFHGFFPSSRSRVDLRSEAVNGPTRMVYGSSKSVTHDAGLRCHP